VLGYVATYAREGIAGLANALDPFALVNYVSIAAVVPGVLTIWLGRYLARTRAGSPRPAAQSRVGSKETSPWNH
jgi:hypothetical protein